MSENMDADGSQLGPFHYEGPGGFEAWGFHFPSGMVIIEWIPASVPDDIDHIDGYHQSVYHSFEDFRTVCTGSIAWGGSP